MKYFICGDDAVALAVRQCKPHVISAYPITPQTIVVERISDYIEDGSLKSTYLYVESEHSAMCSCLGASGTGARTFTATSSQGLLYMEEALHFASGSRFPVVMMNANRAIATPWNINGDQRDSMASMDSGWIQIYVENAQEAYDSLFHAYRVAEDPEVMLPVMVNLDGFILTHTYEQIETVEQEYIDSYIPYRKFKHVGDFGNPMSTGLTVGPDFNTEVHYEQHIAMVKAQDIIDKADAEYAAFAKRSYGGMVEAYKCDDAEVILISVGSVVGTARCVVDAMRAEGKKVGLLKIRCMRPFPAKKVAEICKNAKAVGVLEKDISFGFEGVVYSDVASSLKAAGVQAPAAAYVGGLGGRSISKADITGIYNELLTGTFKTGETCFVNLRGDICHV